MSRTECALISGRGLRWKQVIMALFTVYLDDSGTAPDQQVAMASALLVPGSRITALDDEWNALKKKEEFSDFHMSECLYSNKTPITIPFLLAGMM
jgi:hypothetical protein